MEFALTIEYVSGKITRIVNTPDLHEALNDFVEELKDQSTGYKDAQTIPKILSASISPIWYEPKYKVQKIEPFTSKDYPYI